MKISELIQQLQSIQESHGDISVAVYGQYDIEYWAGVDIDEIEVEDSLVQLVSYDRW